MCLDFHPQHPNLLALGCYDGSVSVYDVRRPTKPLYTSTAANGKHSDPVWELFWQVLSLHATIFAVAATFNVVRSGACSLRVAGQS